MFRINVTSMHVNDQAKARAFYTDTLGFVVKTDEPAGGARWLTVVSPADPDGVELLLEPNEHPAARVYQQALMADGIPAAQFAVDDVQTEVDRLTALGVAFTQEAVDVGPVVIAVFDDTCGNLIQIVAVK